jgi:hypothetical protein
MLKVLSLFVRYGEGTHGAPRSVVSSVDDLHRLYHTQMRAEITTIVIDNALPPDAPPVDFGSHWLLPGDNSCSEFSAWDCGLAFARAEGLRSDVVHLVTSTFQSLYSDYTRFLDDETLRLIAGRDICVGHLDAYNEPVTLFGSTSQHWVRTSCLLLPRETVEALGSLVSIRHTAELFPIQGSALFRDDAPLSESYKDYIVRWISGDDIGQVIHWHSGFVITPEKVPRFRRKAHAIINEHMLAIRLRQLPVRLLDAIWLGYHARRVLVPIAMQGWNPDWRDQIAGRPVGALAFGSDGFKPIRR